MPSNTSASPLHQLLLLGLILLHGAAALQNIIFSNADYGCGAAAVPGGRTYFYFRDAPPCTGGEYADAGTNNVCNGHAYTLLGHDGLSFAGCNGPNGVYPTQVYEDGELALTCRQVEYADPEAEISECERDCAMDAAVIPMYSCT